jgi:hypothetical protein
MGAKKLLGTATMVAPLVLATGCGSSDDGNCTSSGDLTVRVTDANDPPQALCDATVTATGPDGHPQTLTVRGVGGSCTYQGKVTPGTWVISIEHANFQTNTYRQIVTTAQCQVQSATIGIEMQPLH